MPMYEGPSTAALVEAARGGDEAGFALLVLRFRPLACRYANSLLQDPGLAEDACQEALLEAHTQLHQLREAAAFPGWLRRIVLKHADRRRRSRLLFVELGELAGARDPLAAIIEAETNRSVGAGVAALPPRLRDVVALFYVDGNSVKEVAAFLEIRPGAVRKRLFDARVRLRESLANTREQS